jgi:hypothetical protein
MGVVGQRFKALLEKLKPGAAELDEAKRHAQSVRARLADGFDLRAFQIVGSHARDSAISGHSDVDYFAVVSRNDARWGGSYVRSSTLLNRVRDELASRFQQTMVRRDGPAVVVHFGTGSFPVDIVPAYFREPDDSGWPVYQIPNGDHDWMAASPGYHNSYIKGADDRSGGRLHRVARLLKLWRESRTPRIPISSFYMEMVLAKEGLCERHQKTRECLAAAFDELRDLDLEPLDDPLDISGEIEPCRTATQTREVGAALDRAAELAEQALEAEVDGDDDEACYRWDQVFNGEFPA